MKFYVLYLSDLCHSVIDFAGKLVGMMLVLASENRYNWRATMQLLQSQSRLVSR